MNLIKLGWKNSFDKPLNTFLSVLLLALGIGLISFISTVSSTIKERFENNIAGIDMVVGAKGSPLQLILSAVFQIDNPTGNIPVAEVETLAKNRYVGNVIPLSYGDSFNGYRIIGTTPNYLELYGGQLIEGQLWEEEMETVLGSAVATKLNLKVGDSFESAHGLTSEGETHDDHPFLVKGILAPTGTVIDKLILTNTESIWHVHEKEGEELPKEYTAALVKFRSPMGLIQLPRMINKNTSMQAALPSYEINRLVTLMGFGIDTINILAIGIMLVAALSIFISLYTKLKERKYEFAILRSYGASRMQLVKLIWVESLVISLLGLISGLVLSRLMTFSFQSMYENEVGAIAFLSFTSQDLVLLLGTLIISIVAAMLPAISSYRMNIHTILSES